MSKWIRLLIVLVVLIMVGICQYITIMAPNDLVRAISTGGALVLACGCAVLISRVG